MTTMNTANSILAGNLAYSPDLSMSMVDDNGIPYPCSDDEPMAENQYQAIAMTDTFTALRNRFSKGSNFYVASDMFLYYVEGDSRQRLAPDIFVVRNPLSTANRMYWMNWIEGKSPDFVLEVASPSTWRRDANEKRIIYADMDVGEYWRFNPSLHLLPQVRTLVGERLINGQYEPIDTYIDESGIWRGYSDVLELELCARTDEQLRLYDPVAKEWLRTLSESEAAVHARDLIIQERELALRESENARLSAQAENQRLRELLARLKAE